jgi:hypothetical protein
MIALKAALHDGKISMIDALPENIKNARLTIVIEEEFEPKASSIETQWKKVNTNSEEDFKNVGMAAFFDTEDDNNINWEEYFGIKC